MPDNGLRIRFIWSYASSSKICNKFTESSRHNDRARVGCIITEIVLIKSKV